MRAWSCEEPRFSGRERRLPTTTSPGWSTSSKPWRRRHEGTMAWPSGSRESRWSWRVPLPREARPGEGDDRVMRGRARAGVSLAASGFRRGLLSVARARSAAPRPPVASRDRASGGLAARRRSGVERRGAFGEGFAGGQPLVAGRCSTVLAWVALVVGCAGAAPYAQQVGELAQRLERAREGGAAECAPRLLAVAESQLHFAQLQLQQGDSERASGHLQRARLHTTAAERATLAVECAAPRAKAAAPP